MSYLQLAKKIQAELKLNTTEPAAAPSDLADGTVKAVRRQTTEFRDLRIDETTTGVLICSTVLDADIWLALRDDFEPDPDLPFAVFYIDENPDSQK